MSEWGGLVPTGRRLAGAATDLIELDDGSDGLKFTAIQFHDRYVQSELLKTSVELAKSFMEFPMVAGLVELQQHYPDRAAFVYPTGTSWTAAEVVRAFRDSGGGIGTRATLEVLYLAGCILQEAAENGPIQGVFSHGSMSPNRILIKSDGQVQIIGYAIPQIELLQWRDGLEERMPSEESFRYCPPERLEGAPENGDADLFALALAGFEMFTGDPVYDGSAEAIHDLAKKAAARDIVDRAAKKGRLHPPIRDLLVRALDPDPLSRHETPGAFVAEVEGLLSGLQSSSKGIADVMEQVRSTTKRGRALQAGDGRSRAIGGKASDVLKAQAPGSGVPIHTYSGQTGPRLATAPPGEGEEAVPTGQAAAPQAESRWGKRERKKEDAPAAIEDKSGAVGASAAKALRDRMREQQGAKEAAAPSAAQSARDRLRERLKKGTEGEAPAAGGSAPAPEAPKAVDPREALREKLRARAAGGSAPVAAPAAEAPKAAPAPEAPKPAPAPKAEPTPKADLTASGSTPAADPREALREKLRARAAGSAGGAPAAEAPKAPEAPKAAGPAKAPEPAPAAAAPAASGEAEDPREALRRKLRERSSKS